MEMTTKRIGTMIARRPKSKKGQALDVVASVAKTWSEWQLGKRATKQAAALKGGKRSGLMAAMTGTPAKITGVVTLVGGAGALIARRLKGSGDQHGYAPPESHEPMPAPPAGVSPTTAAITHNETPPPSLSTAAQDDSES